MEEGGTQGQRAGSLFSASEIEDDAHSGVLLFFEQGSEVGSVKHLPAVVKSLCPIGSGEPASFGHVDLSVWSEFGPSS